MIVVYALFRDTHVTKTQTSVDFCAENHSGDNFALKTISEINKKIKKFYPLVQELFVRC